MLSAAPIPLEVMRAFGLPGECSQTRLGGTKNVNYRIETAGGCVLARRRHPDYCSPAWIGFDHAGLAHLSQASAAVCEPLKCVEGASWFEHEGDLYEVFPWVSGNEFVQSEKSVRSVGERLADLHCACVGFGLDPPIKGGRPRAETSPVRLQETIAHGLCLPRRHAEVAAYYTEQVTIAAERLTDQVYFSLPGVIVHGDVQPANTIFSGSCLKRFVDYDWLNIQPCVYDLAFAAIMFCGRRESPVDGTDIWSLSQPFIFDEHLVEQFLQAYCARFGELSADSRRALLEQLRLTWAHIRVDGARKVPREQRAAFLSRDLERPFAWIDAKPADWI